MGHPILWWSGGKQKQVLRFAQDDNSTSFRLATCLQGDGDGRDSHSLVAGVEAVFAVQGAAGCFAGTAGAVSGGVGIWHGAGVSEGRAGELFAVSGAGRDWDDGVVFLGVFRDGAALGSAVRLPEGDAGGSGAAYSDHGWKDAGWRNGGRDS